LTLRQFEAALSKRLADGYFRNPQVSVAVETYRSQRIFIVGEVRNPGTYPLTGDMTSSRPSRERDRRPPTRVRRPSSSAPRREDR